MRTAALFAEANIKAQAVQQRMTDDINQVETMNAQAEADDAQIIPLLQVAADAPEDLKDDEEGWKGWWNDKLGYSYQSPPQVTIVQDVSPPQLPAPRLTTCFAAGTAVQTLDGPRPIESIQVGDQVLSQDAVTGALSFQPVVFLHHNPPGKTLRISFSGSDSVVCSVYHRFWRPNVGWAMARELKPGDVLRTLGGLVRVAGVEPDATQPLYNLDVARIAHLLRRRGPAARARQHAPRPSPQAVRRAARRGRGRSSGMSGSRIDHPSGQSIKLS